VRLHARIAQALENLYGDDAEAHAAELAHHFVESQSVLGAEKAVRYSLLAGERALATYAHEDALAHFQRGLTAKEVSLTGSETADDAKTAALLFGLGCAQSALLQRSEALANFHRAFDYYSDVGDVDGAIAIARHPIPLEPGNTDVTQLIRRALAIVPSNSHEAGRLFAHYGRMLGIEEGNYAEAQEAFNLALDIAQRQGDLALETRTVANAASVDTWYHHWEEGLRKNLIAIDLARQVDDLIAQVLGRFHASIALMAIGDLPGAKQHTEDILSPAERLRDRYYLAIAYWANQLVAQLQGDWRAARDFSDRGLASAPRDGRLLGTRVLLEYEVGDFDQGSAYLERLLEATHLIKPGPTWEHASTTLAIGVAARITGIMDQFSIAEAAADAFLSSPYATPLWACVARSGKALIAVQRVDTPAAAEQCTALRSLRGTFPGAAPIAIDRLLGLLSQTMGNLGQAMEHFEDALAFCRKAGYRPELAWTCCDYADMLLERASTSSARTESEEDRAKATSLLDESLAISSELGMRPLMERVLSRREILGA